MTDGFEKRVSAPKNRRSGIFHMPFSIAAFASFAPGLPRHCTSPDGTNIDGVFCIIRR